MMTSSIALENYKQHLCVEKIAEILNYLHSIPKGQVKDKHKVQEKDQKEKELKAKKIFSKSNTSNSFVQTISVSMLPLVKLKSQYFIDLLFRYVNTYSKSFQCKSQIERFQQKQCSQWQKQ